MDKYSLFAQWAVFAVGTFTFVFVLFKRTENTTSPKIFVMLLFPTVLILGALFAFRLKTIELSPSGIQLANFEMAKEAAAMSIKENPALAEKITSKRGAQAVSEAYSRIESTKSWHELKEIVPLEAIHFQPVLRGNTIELIPTSPYGLDTASKRVAKD